MVLKTNRCSISSHRYTTSHRYLMMGCMHVRWIVSWRCLLKESATWIIWAMEGANWIRTRIGFQSGTMRSARKCVRGTRNHLQMWKFVRILIKIIWCWDFPKKSISAKFCFQKYIPYENFSPALEGGVLTGIAEGDTSGAAGLELLDPRLWELRSMRCVTRCSSVRGSCFISVLIAPVMWVWRNISY